MKYWFISIFLGLIISTGLAQNALEFKEPLREVSIIATKDGFFPKAVSVHEGERVRFFLTSTHDTPDCFVLQNHKVFLAAEKGKVSEKDVVFNEPGRYKFYCPSSKHSGFVTVIEKVSPQDVHGAHTSRAVAGETSKDYDDGAPSVWTPKDY